MTTAAANRRHSRAAWMRRRQDAVESRLASVDEVGSTVAPTPKQAEFVALTQRNVLWGGAAAAGKTQGLAFAATAHIDQPHYRALLVTQTDKVLSHSGGLYDALRAMYPGVRINRGTREMRFPSGALIEFKTLPDSISHERTKGSTYHFIGVDEAGNIFPHQLEWLPRSLRRRIRDPIALRYRMTANPGGVAHDWLRTRFVQPAEPNPNNFFLHAAQSDNPHMDMADYAASFELMDAHTRMQFVEGLWDDPADGVFFQVGRMRYYDALPQPIRAVRAWDLAATARREADFTVGALVVEAMDEAEGRRAYYIHDLQRGQIAAGDVERLILDTAATDGERVDVAIEQEIGASGKLFIDRIRGLTSAHVQPMRPSGDKKHRARVLAGMLQDGRLYLNTAMNAERRRALESEMRRFGEPGLLHDDIVDALTYALTYLTASGGGIEVWV